MTRSQDRSPETVLDRFTVSARVQIRPCAASDLAKLEWHGWFTPHRGIIAEAFARHLRDQVRMLVAESAGFPVGQIWIDFEEGGPATARLWAFRVMPCMRGLGIGGRLLRAAEQTMLARGLHIAEVGCEQSNAPARRFYEQRGYTLAGEQRNRYAYHTPAGENVTATSDLWILRKRLGPRTGAA